MNVEQILLTQLAEECNEVAQRCSKALRFGLSEIQPGQKLSNAERIVQEFHDLVAVYEMLVGANSLPDTHYIQGMALKGDKKEKIRKYLQYSKDCGVLK